MKEKAGVVIPAAGSGTRMGSIVPKQFLHLAGKPLLVYSVNAFAQCDFISQVVVVAGEDWYEPTTQLLAELIPENSKTMVVVGGQRRQDSVRNGLNALDETIDVVLVHDGARPLVSGGLIERCYSAILEYGAAIAAVPVKDTLKKADDGQKVAATVDRDMLWQAQTPQGARRDLLASAYEQNGDSDVTDESTLLEKAGIPVHLVAGEESNLKITRNEDLILAESIMTHRAGTIRIGHGFDAHRFSDFRALILGGVEIAYHRGLAGHSDADVVCHALCDAILGALGSGDIGRHFPDNDPSYEGISSLILLDRVMEQCGSQGMKLTNADVTVVCQAPRLAPYIAAMQSNLARHCLVGPENMNIKATTTEKMGYVGREEGISCHAVVLIEKR
ncbi:MAG: 2-C-methyl-D-erythritol 4-phosphate cytidylyltransferase [Desulfofustis sp.]|nr:2-C-methyl-D-erythritol 4-phosphate cytidylyltransferase [Desulfofustis sp.]